MGDPCVWGPRIYAWLDDFATVLDRYRQLHYCVIPVDLEKILHFRYTAEQLAAVMSANDMDYLRLIKKHTDDCIGSCKRSALPESNAMSMEIPFLDGVQTAYMMRNDDQIVSANGFSKTGVFSAREPRTAAAGGTASLSLASSSSAFVSLLPSCDEKIGCNPSIPAAFPSPSTMVDHCIQHTLASNLDSWTQFQKMAGRYLQKMNTLDRYLLYAGYVCSSLNQSQIHDRMMILLMHYTPMTLEGTFQMCLNAIRVVAPCLFCRMDFSLFFESVTPCQNWFDGKTAIVTPKPLIQTIPPTSNVQNTHRDWKSWIWYLRNEINLKVERAEMQKQKDSVRTPTTTSRAASALPPAAATTTSASPKAVKSPTRETFEKRSKIWTSFSGGPAAIFDTIIILCLNFPKPSKSVDVSQDEWQISDYQLEKLKEHHSLHDSILQSKCLKRGGFVLFLITLNNLCAYMPGYQSMVGSFIPFESNRPPYEWDPIGLAKCMIRRQWLWYYISNDISTLLSKLLSEHVDLYKAMMTSFGERGSWPETPPDDYVKAVIDIYQLTFGDTRANGI